MSRATVYGDVYMLVNFLCDLTVLFFTSRFLHKNPRPWRLILSALTGAVYALVHLYCARLRLLDFLLSLLFSLFMLFIVFFPEKPRFFCRAALAFYTLSLLTGGGVSLFCGFFFKEIKGPYGALLLLLLLFLLCPGAILGAVFLQKRKSAGFARVTLFCNGERRSFEALIDSANLLKEPRSGLPALIVSLSVFENAQPLCEGILLSKTLSGQCPLPYFMPESIAVNGRKTDAAVALCPETQRFCGCPALLPAALLHH